MVSSITEFVTSEDTYSAIVAFGGSKEEALGTGAGESSMMSSSSAGVEIGVGDVTSNCVEKGVLWGRGETSMSSVRGAGDEDGKGGVLTYSVSH
jgi:hypothetical protein